MAIARRVKERTEGRVPVLVGATFEGGLEEQAKLMNIMGEFADSVVIITNQIATMEEVKGWEGERGGGESLLSLAYSDLNWRILQILPRSANTKLTINITNLDSSQLAN